MSIPSRAYSKPRDHSEEPAVPITDTALPNKTVVCSSDSWHRVRVHQPLACQCARTVHPTTICKLQTALQANKSPFIFLSQTHTLFDELACLAVGWIAKLRCGTRYRAYSVHFTLSILHVGLKSIDRASAVTEPVRTATEAVKARSSACIAN